MLRFRKWAIGLIYYGTYVQCIHYISQGLQCVCSCSIGDMEKYTGTKYLENILYHFENKITEGLMHNFFPMDKHSNE